MLIYGCLGAGVFVSQLLNSVIAVFVFVNASSTLHKKVFNTVIKSPLRFFDTTPVGRILNRLSRDQDELDTRLPWVAESFIREALRIVIALVFISVIYPWFIAALIPLGVLFFLLNVAFRRTLREVKRIDNLTRSPLFSHLTTTVQGLPTLHAYKKTQEYIIKFNQLIDDSTAPFFIFHVATRWFSARLDFICIVIAAATGLIAIFTKGAIPPSLAALAITYALRVCCLLYLT